MTIFRLSGTKIRLFLTCLTVKLVDLKWKLYLYPDGRKSEGYMSLYLYPIDCNKNRVVEFSLSLVRNDAVLKKYKVENCIFKSARKLLNGLRNFISKDTLEKELIANGSSSSLTVKFTIKYINVEHLFSAAKQLELSLVDMRSLLKDWKEDPTADVTFKIKKAELKAHKFILASNSNVFRAMFYGEYQEKSKAVVIKDVDYDVMVALFDYIYTRDMKYEDVQFMLNLATAANKYDIGRLYKICISFALENLSGDNVVDAILFAELHDENKLKQSGFQLLKDKKFKDIKKLATLYKHTKIMDEMLMGNSD